MVVLIVLNPWVRFPSRSPKQPLSLRGRSHHILVVAYLLNRRTRGPGGSARDTTGGLCHLGRLQYIPAITNGGDYVEKWPYVAEILLYLTVLLCSLSLVVSINEIRRHYIRNAPRMSVLGVYKPPFLSISNIFMLLLHFLLHKYLNTVQQH
jgi:hypothetical protein